MLVIYHGTTIHGIPTIPYGIPCMVYHIQYHTVPIQLHADTEKYWLSNRRFILMFLIYLHLGFAGFGHIFVFYGHKNERNRPFMGCISCRIVDGIEGKTKSDVTDLAENFRKAALSNFEINTVFTFLNFPI